MNAPVTPLRQANGLVNAAALLAGVGAYSASVNHVPVLDTTLEGISCVLYRWLPVLSSIHLPNAQALVGAAGAGMLVLIVGTLCATPLSKLFKPQASAMETQMRQRETKLKRIKRIR